MLEGAMPIEEICSVRCLGCPVLSGGQFTRGMLEGALPSKESCIVGLDRAGAVLFVVDHCIVSNLVMHQGFSTCLQARTEPYLQQLWALT